MKAPREISLVVMAAALCLAGDLAGARPGQSDLDELMGQVLQHRDENWKKLQQYVLEERETMEVTALDGRRIYGFKREYQWFPRDGFFIKSPLSADGVKIGDEERRRSAKSVARKRALGRNQRIRHRQRSRSGRAASTPTSKPRSGTR